MNIRIENPCQEDWNKMETSHNGKFCSVCTKNVIDFTTFSETEIVNYFKDFSGKTNICGRFRKKQLATINIEIPTYLLYSPEVTYWQKFLILILVFFSSFLFSCSEKQAENKQKVEVVLVDSSKIDSNFVTENSKLKCDSEEINSLHTVGMVVPKDFEENEMITGKIGYDNNYNDNIIEPFAKEIKTENDYNGLYLVVEEMPKFQSGDKQEMIDFFKNHIKKDLINNKNVGNKVIITFIIDTTGKAINPEIVKGLSKEMDNEALRLISIMPKWKPGRQDGRNVNVKYTIPIKFE